MDGLVTAYLEAGQGDPVVLLHGGEFGVSAELGWEHTIAALATNHRVLAPDMLGFGGSAKVIDFNDGRGMRIRHIARFCETLGVESAHFVGNSMGAVNLFVDTTSDVAGCCPCAAWWRSAAAARSSEMNIRPRSTTTTPRSTECDGSSGPLL